MVNAKALAIFFIFKLISGIIYKIKEVNIMNEAYEKIKNRLLEYKKKNYIVPTEKMIKT